MEGGGRKERRKEGRMKREGRDREREGRRKEEREGGSKSSQQFIIFLGTLLLRGAEIKILFEFFFLILKIYFSVPNQCIN